MSVFIRPMSAEKNIGLDARYTVEDVIDQINAAAAQGRSVIVLDGSRGEKHVISIGGTEPFTVRDKS